MGLCPDGLRASPQILQQCIVGSEILLETKHANVLYFALARAFMYNLKFAYDAECIRKLVAMGTLTVFDV